MILHEQPVTRTEDARPFLLRRYPGGESLSFPHLRFSVEKGKRKTMKMTWRKNRAAHRRQEAENGSHQEISDAERIKLKFEAIWKARDNELNAVRERSLLVWGFLLFCYTGYGWVAHSVLVQSGMQPFRLRICNLALLLMSFVCFRLSLFWIKMMKGAKAWAETNDFLAEAYQHRLLSLLPDYASCPFRTPEGRDAIRVSKQVFVLKNCVSCGGDPSYACLFSVADPNPEYAPQIDDCVLSTRGGAFSPTAVVIAIARFSMAIAFSLCCVHIVVAIFGLEFIRRHSGGWMILVVACSLPYGIVSVVVFLRHHLLWKRQRTSEPEQRCWLDIGSETLNGNRMILDAMKDKQ